MAISLSIAIGLTIYDFLHSDHSRSSLTLFMSVLFYLLQYITDNLPFWFIYGLTISNALGIPILFFGNCDIVNDINLGFQIFYHLIPLELCLTCLDKFKTIPSRWVFGLIFILHIMFDTILYKYDILEIYKCSHSKELGVILLYTLDVISNIFVFITYIIIIKKKEI